MLQPKVHVAKIGLPPWQSSCSASRSDRILVQGALATCKSVLGPLH